MSDETTNNSQNTTADTPSDGSLNTTQGGESANNLPETVPYSRFSEVNKRMRELEKQLETVQKAEADRQAKAKAEADKAAAEQGKFKELYESKLAELEALKPALDSYNELKKQTAARNEERLKALSDEQKSLMPQTDDPFTVSAWLDRAERLLVKRDSPDLDAGRRSDARPNNPPLVTRKIRL